MKLGRLKRGLLCVVAAMTCAVVIAFAFRDTPENGTIDGPADRIVIEKHAHTLTLYRQGKVLKTYRVPSPHRRSYRALHPDSASNVVR